MFDDLSERARMDPDGLLQQLCSLSVGPLMTYDFGQTLSDRLDLLQLYVRFIQI
jgi:hypothetical protein